MVKNQEICLIEKKSNLMENICWSGMLEKREEQS